MTLHPCASIESVCIIYCAIWHAVSSVTALHARSAPGSDQNYSQAVNAVALDLPLYEHGVSSPPPACHVLKKWWVCCSKSIVQVAPADYAAINNEMSSGTRQEEENDWIRDCDALHTVINGANWKSAQTSCLSLIHHIARNLGSNSCPGGGNKTKAQHSTMREKFKQKTRTTARSKHVPPPPHGCLYHTITIGK